METIIVTTSRSPVAFSLSEMEMLLGSALVIAMLAWMVLTRVRRRPGRQA